MKRFIILLMSFAMIFTLVSCGNINSEDANKEKVMTKEEMLKVAVDAPLEVMKTAKEENIVIANETYSGKVYRFTGRVTEINQSYIIIVPIKKGFSRIHACMPIDDIKQVSVNQFINIVGCIDAFIDNEASSYLNLDSSYYVDDIIKIEGTVDSAGYWRKGKTELERKMVRIETDLGAFAFEVDDLERTGSVRVYHNYGGYGYETRYCGIYQGKKLYQPNDGNDATGISYVTIEGKIKQYGDCNEFDEIINIDVK